MRDFGSFGPGRRASWQTSHHTQGETGRRAGGRIPHRAQGTTPRGKLSLAAPGAGGHACACVCTRLCSLGCSQRLRSSLRVPLSPLTRRLTGGWPHPSSTGLSHGTRLTVLSEGHSQSPADRSHPNPAPAGQGSARARQRPRAGTNETQGKLASSASPRAALLFFSRPVFL